MRLEDLVCDLKYAKKLSELGVRQESNFYWYGNNIKEYKINTNKVSEEFCFNYSAFTSDEILEKLPQYIGMYDRCIETDEDSKYNHIVSYMVFPKQLKMIYFEDDKLSNALARMWTFLIENEYIEG